MVRAWEGLGYNRRARALHATAEAVVARHGGRVPADLVALEALPGIGPYTARAVLAFAFEDEAAVLDTNVARVLARAVAGRPLRPARGPGAGRPAPARRARRGPTTRPCSTSGPDTAGPVPTARAARSGAGAPGRGRVGPTPTRPGPRPAPRGRSPASPAPTARAVAGWSPRLRRGPIAAAAVAAAAGWPEDPDRAERVLADLVAEGLVGRSADGSAHLV